MSATEENSSVREYNTFRDFLLSLDTTLYGGKWRTHNVKMSSKTSVIPLKEKGGLVMAPVQRVVVSAITWMGPVVWGYVISRWETQYRVGYGVKPPKVNRETIHSVLEMRQFHVVEGEYTPEDLELYLESYKDGWGASEGVRG